MSSSPLLRDGPIAPWILDPESQWVTVKQFSILYHRSQRRLQQMLQSGDLLLFGIATYQDASGRWWLRIPRQ